MTQIEGIKLTKIKNITTPNGSVLHALKYSENDLDIFAETYFSLIKKNRINGWKMHNEMSLNLIVPVGEVKFNFIDSFDSYHVNWYIPFYSHYCCSLRCWSFFTKERYHYTFSKYLIIG